MVLVSINGNFTNSGIPVTDRGLLFGESVYEVLLIQNHRPFHLKKHLQRLDDNFYQMFHTRLDLKQINHWIFDYLAATQHVECNNLYIQLTSGTMPIRNHVTNHIQPTCIIHQTHAEAIHTDVYKQGFRAIAVPDTRSSLSNIKTNHLALNTQALILASKRGYDDAVFIRDNKLVEAASSNVFIVKDNVLITPPVDGIVNGLTRQTILSLAKNNHIPIEVRHISLSEAAKADEIFLSSSIKLLKPLKEIENLFSSSGHFPIWQRLFNLYLQEIYAQTQSPIACH